MRPSEGTRSLTASGSSVGDRGHGTTRTPRRSPAYHSSWRSPIGFRRGHGQTWHVRSLVPRRRAARVTTPGSAHPPHYLNLADTTPLPLAPMPNSWHSSRISQWMTLAARHGNGWYPPTRLVGGKHVAAALRDGRGAILWVAPFALPASRSSRVTEVWTRLDPSHTLDTWAGPGRSRRPAHQSTLHRGRVPFSRSAGRDRSG